MALDDLQLTRDKEGLQFLPSHRVAHAMLDSMTAPVQTCMGAFHPLPLEQIVNSAQAATESPVADVVATSIGERIERMLATLGFDAADRGAESIVVSEGDDFCAGVRDQVLLRLQLPRDDRHILPLLVQDLHATLRESPIRGDWGELREDGSRLVLIPAPQRAQDAESSRLRAKVVGGTLIR